MFLLIRRTRLRSLSLPLLAIFLALPLNLALPRTARAALAIGNPAIVITTEGDVLSVRQGPGHDSAVVGYLAQGTQVMVLGGPETSADGLAWYQVQGAGLSGWSDGEWLAEVDTTANATTPTPPPAPADNAAPPTAAAQTGGQLSVSGTGGKGARLRDAPSLHANILLVVPDGALVNVTGAPAAADSSTWTPVTYSGTAGWIASFLLGAAGATAPALASTPTPDAPPADAPAPTPVSTPPPAPPENAAPPTAAPPPAPPTAVQFVAGDHAAVVNTDGLDLRIRGDVGTSAPILTAVAPGTVLLVTAGPRQDADGADWYGVQYGDLHGWVMGEHLGPTSATLSQPAGAAPAGTSAPAATPPPSPQPPTTSAPALPPAQPGDRGAAIAALALKYLGAPYKWAGVTPAGWDCSGFVLYVYQQAAGITLPRTAADQFTVGAPIRLPDVHAGDIVFFADTNGPGITHNGIALGDGRFIHARSENTGTVISSLSDPYWSSHFAGARRP
ncbi:MAG: NlpC/P60 family protein [Thermomicrobiales bacterium]